MRIITKEGPVALDFSFAQEVKQKSGQPIELCFQCQKCAAGCPVSPFIDYSPNQVIRMIQYGLRERIFKSAAIWLCSSCETCGARCPNGIRIAEVMDTLRQMAVEQKIKGKEKKVPVFHESFLKSVQTHGRVHEAFMLARYKLKSKTMWEDIDVGLKFIKKRKLPILPNRIRGRKQIKEIFHRCTCK